MQNSTPQPLPRGDFDRFRMVAALLVVAIHTSPLYSVSPWADFVLTRVLARVAVPFFFMLTGYFTVEPCLRENSHNLNPFFLKTGLLYLAAVLLYLPLNLLYGYFNEPQAGIRFLRDILFNGTYYHLWYLPALLLAVPMVCGLLRQLGTARALVITSLLYLVGLGGDSYYGLVTELPTLASFYDGVFVVFDYTRNGLFMAPIFVCMGAVVARYRLAPQKRVVFGGLLLGLAAMLVEGIWVANMGFARHDSMYLFLPIVMLYLMLLLVSLPQRQDPALRKASTWVYLLHPWVIVLVRGGARVLSLSDLLLASDVVYYLIICAVTGAFALLARRGVEHLQNQRPA